MMRSESCVECGSFTGIDISPKTVERAGEKLNSFDNVTLICSDFLNYNFAEQFDVIYSSLTFMHIKEKQKAIKIAADLLNPDGRFVLSIDKNQDTIIDYGIRQIEVYPDTPEEIDSLLTKAAARLLSYYAIPKDHPFVANYVAAMRDDEVLRQEFSYIPPEIPRFENRFEGLNNGNSLMALIYVMQAMMGYGDDTVEVREFQQICLKGFRRVLEISSIDDITKTRKSKNKYNYPYIEADEYFPDAYTLAMLAYTQSWRTNENVQMLASSLNHINAIMKPDTNMHVKIGSNYYGPCFALNRPIRAFKPDVIDTITYRRTLTEIAMLGVGERVDIIHESVANIENSIDADGVLRMRFDLPHNKRYSPKSIEYPTAYVDVRLEPDYKKKTALDCDLTFWAVQFLTLVG